ncbi:MAG TPA: hypothetical protein ENH10_03225 [Bacteroidetes bacterium]|nr:tyrosine recombinase XerC [bacterium BMS3Bbin04]HDO65029.1 hypothetical protein [Bacteroidota bacterium]HEX04154.1 hypothetical protein [Bacteroidota bacterium]
MAQPYPPNVRKRTNPKGKTAYYIDYFDPFKEERVRETVGTRKDLAQQKAVQVYNELMAKWNGVPEPVEVVDVLLTDLANRFLADKQIRTRSSTYRRYRAPANNFVQFMKDSFPKITNAGQVTKAQIDEYLTHRHSMKMAAATLNMELRAIKAMFNYAIEQGWVEENPAKKIKIFNAPEGAGKPDFWTQKQVTKILEVSKPWYRDAFEFLYRTGIRREELTHLTWGDVTNLNGDDPNIAIQGGPQKNGWLPKTGKRRIVPLSPQAATIIRRQQMSTEHSFVFKSKYGKVMRGNKLRDELARALKELGFEGNVHKFRHTFASQLVMKNVTLQTVGELLGHSDPQTTMIYAHLAPDHLRNAVSKLDDKT